MTYRLTLPGAGAVLLDVGHVVVDQEGNISLQKGSHQFYGGDVAGLCTALAQCARAMHSPRGIADAGHRSVQPFVDARAMVAVARTRRP